MMSLAGGGVVGKLKPQRNAKKGGEEEQLGGITMKGERERKECLHGN